MTRCPELGIGMLRKVGREPRAGSLNSVLSPPNPQSVGAGPRAGCLFTRQAFVSFYETPGPALDGEL